MEWKKITSENSVNSRHGHTGLLFQKKLFVFGGKIKMDKFFYMADLEIFNLETKQWSVPITYTRNTLCLRSNHIAELIGKDFLYKIIKGSQMFIHGGIN